MPNCYNSRHNNSLDILKMYLNCFFFSIHHFTQVFPLPTCSTVCFVYTNPSSFWEILACFRDVGESHISGESRNFPDDLGPLLLSFMWSVNMTSRHCRKHSRQPMQQYQQYKNKRLENVVKLSVAHMPSCMLSRSCGRHKWSLKQQYLQSI